MNYHYDITLLPNTEINLGFLWQKIFTQIHMSLVAHKQDNQSEIAVSFPEYGGSDFPMGNKLRLLASTEEKLLALDLDAQLVRFSDYCHVTSMKQVPVTNQYACFSRKQFKTNIERRARRRVKRTNESIEQAISQLKSKGFLDKQSNLPFINLESLSTRKDQHPRHKFRLFIDRVLVNKAVDGAFSCYGLSNQATVPWF